MLSELRTIPVSVLEKSVEQNRFALLRFFVELFGIETSRTILALISENPDNQKLSEVNEIITARLLEIFPRLKNLNQSQIEEIILEKYRKANEITEQLIQLSYPGMEHELGLLDTTGVPTVDLASRISLMMSNGESTPRYKYELLRQDVLALMLMELAKYNNSVSNSKKIHCMQEIFEKDLYQGNVGEVQAREIFSVHSSEDNYCLSTFSNIEEAEAFINSQESANNLHIKSHKWQMRNIDGIGYVLANMRTKSDFSIVRKMIYNSSKDKSQRPKIKIGTNDDLFDTTGFMFVVDTDESNNMINRLIFLIRNSYPHAKFVTKDRVKTDRGQSEKVSFRRFLVYLDEERNPIEVIVMEQRQYMNYRFELEQAHELYSRRKSSLSAEKLFPQEVFGYDDDEVIRQRDLENQSIKERLLAQGHTQS
ncbi:MAG: hypothetical protein GW941_01415 [Candidatus Pacebacteria bacterium]|nr:hypothetical protein [Candidatus Paceibacterota bacterium]